MLNTMSPKKKMKPTPSALKWLAEKRARVAFDLQFNLTLLNELRNRPANPTLQSCEPRPR